MLGFSASRITLRRRVRNVRRLWCSQWFHPEIALIRNRSGMPTPVHSGIEQVVKVSIPCTSTAQVLYPKHGILLQRPHVSCVFACEAAAVTCYHQVEWFATRILRSTWVGTRKLWLRRQLDWDIHHRTLSAR
jgi:hypothetical protein